MNRVVLDRVLAGVATIVVVGSVAAAIIQNPPHLQRLRAIDEHRVADLQSIYGRISHVWNTKKVLPDSLSALCERCAEDYKDPETNEPYGYEKTGEKSYRLCAGFATDNRKDQDQQRFGTYLPDWRHEAGRKCFDLTVSSNGNNP